jgi:hypothetical protein
MEATWEHDPDSRLDITDATSDTPVQVRGDVNDHIVKHDLFKSSLEFSVSIFLEMDQDRN